MYETHKIINSSGSIFWIKRGTNIYHREDGPAIECSDGTKFWYKNDQLHRIDGPAIKWVNGNRAYCVNNNFIGEFSAELIRYRESYLINV